MNMLKNKNQTGINAKHMLVLQPINSNLKKILAIFVDGSYKKISKQKQSYIFKEEPI